MKQKASHERTLASFFLSPSSVCHVFPFCSLNSLLSSFHIHPTALSVCWVGTFPFYLPYLYEASLCPSPLSHFPSIPQAAGCVGEGCLPLKMSGLAVLLPCSSPIAPSLPARMRHHHLVGQGMQCMVHNLHFNGVVRWQVPQRTWGGKKIELHLTKVHCLCLMS